MIDTASMTSLHDLHEVAEDDPEELRDLHEAARGAQDYLESHWWCKEVQEGYFDRGFSKFAVFYFRYAVSEGSRADPECWIIAGDIPPAFLDTYYCRNGAEAVNAYVYLMREWGEATVAGTSVEKFYPVAANGSFRLLQPTPELGQMLIGRMDFIEKNLLAEWQDEIGPEPPPLEP